MLNQCKISNIRPQLAFRIVILVFGLTSVGFGASLFILSNIGSDPFNVLMQGLSIHLGVTVGQANIIVSFIYAVIIFFWDRQYIQIGTLIAVFSLGTVIDIGINVLTPIFDMNLHYAIRFTTMISGSVFIAFGVAIIYCVKIGMVPNDALPVIISNKIKLPFKWVRMAYDLAAVIIGTLLGGVFGVGTIVCALITGPLIAFFIPHVDTCIHRVLRPDNAMKTSNA